MRDRAPADLFARLPGYLRTRDAAEGRPLEALMGLFRTELGVIEQDLDQLYDNWFVETCEPWVLPYIAALIGARPMREIGEDQAGLLRAYIANVLQYRQAKGTAAVVEQAARDVSGWPVVAVEFFQRLTTSQNVNHLRQNAVAFPDVRDSAKVRRSRSPFSTMAHGAAAGAPNGWSGRYNIPHLGIFVWRQSAAPLWQVEDEQSAYMGGPEPFVSAAEPGLLRFDPLGRDLPLVNRPDADKSVAARMTARTVPAELTRGEVYEALNAARETGATPGEWFENAPPFVVRLDGADVPPDQLFCCDLSKTETGGFRRPDEAGDVMVDPELGRLSLHPDDEGAQVEVGFAQASSFDIGGGAYDRRESVERWLSDLAIAGEPDPWQIGVTKVAAHVTDDPDQGVVVSEMREAIKRWNEHAAGNPGARGIITVMDNANFEEALNGQRRIILPAGAKLAIVAAAWPATDKGGGAVERQKARLSPMHRRPCLAGPITVDALDAGDGDGGELVIDGLAVRKKIQLRDAGDLSRLSLYNCTVGGAEGELDAPVACGAGNERASLIAHRCVLSSIDLPTLAGTLSISRSIIGEDRTADGGAPSLHIIRAPGMDADISGSTVFGRASLRTIEAENSLLLGRIELEHKQQGCVRFCYATRDSALPRRYRCAPGASDPDSMQPVFSSSRFQDSGFARLSLSTPPEIREGAEDGMEMGVGFSNRDPARLANMMDAIEEFAPFGLTPGVIFVT